MGGGSGLELGDVIGLIDEMKDSLRNEFANKNQFNKLLERVTINETKINDIFKALDNLKKKIGENKEAIDSNINLTRALNDGITEAQNQIRKVNDELINKVDSDEIETINNIVQEVYDQVMEIQKGTSAGSGQTA